MFGYYSRHQIPNRDSQMWIYCFSSLVFLGFMDIYLIRTDLILQVFWMLSHCPLIIFNILPWLSLATPKKKKKEKAILGTSGRQQYELYFLNTNTAGTLLRLFYNLIYSCSNWTLSFSQQCGTLGKETLESLGLISHSDRWIRSLSHANLT